MLAAAVLRAGCLLATDPVAAVAELGAALLRQVDVELAVAAVPMPGSCEFLNTACLTEYGHRLASVSPGCRQCVAVVAGSRNAWHQIYSICIRL